jgi:hypothetical protein
MDQRSQLTAEVDRPWTRPIVLVPVFALISLVGGALPSLTLPANLLVLGTGGALFWIGMSNTVPRRAAPRRLSRHAVWWMLPLLVLAAIELTNFMFGSTYSHPTLSLLFDPVLEGYLARSALYFGWLTAFWGLIRR